MKKLSDIKNRDELAEFLDIPRKRLTYVLYIKKVDSYYKEFELPKKSGGTRRISAPDGELKTIQLKLYYALKKHKYFDNSPNESKTNISHAFEKDKSIITNATIHRNKRYVVNLDLKDFFNSFHFGRVCGYFEKNMNFNLPHEVAIILAQLLCYKGSLPQGAPASPIMTNLICEIFDMQLLKLSKRYKLDYTRYADDLTFSTNDRKFLEVYDLFIEQVSRQIELAGFLINKKKTRLQFRDSQQKVTGLIVNKKIQVDKAYYKTTRAMADKLYKTGEFYIDKEVGSLEQLEGRFSFIDQLSKYNNKISGKDPKNNNLSGREKEYRKFLFYKYFYVNKKPLIVTEGKTDILYLKAALKNMYADYPELVSMNEKGNFSFNISFLNRTKRLAHFFNFSSTGADAMYSLYKYYYDRPCNYFDFFNKTSKKLPERPVFFVFDNELNNKNKPISKFLNNISKKTVEMETDDGSKLIKLNKGNLYLATNSLVGDKQECAIEDLLDESVLEMKIDGKSFSSSDNYDISKFYGKDTFSKYVLANYKTINFSRFCPMLDKIKKTIKDYNDKNG